MAFTFFIKAEVYTFLLMLINVSLEFQQMIVPTSGLDIASVEHKFSKSEN